MRRLITAASLTAAIVLGSTGAAHASEGSNTHCYQGNRAYGAKICVKEDWYHGDSWKSDKVKVHTIKYYPKYDSTAAKKRTQSISVTGPTISKKEGYWYSDIVYTGNDFSLTAKNPTRTVHPNVTVPRNYVFSFSFQIRKSTAKDSYGSPEFKVG